ncbi:MAG: hypothetical protein IT348_19710 [Candidatus Eisenbacteria bacterium]|nr:hypothetical protein [Candidatus Eisenbacteria bacterium]
MPRPLAVRMRSSLWLLPLALAAAAGPALAAWPHDPSVGVPVVNEASGQFNPVSVSDGAGGVIVAWQDARSGGTYDIYAQRISNAGVALWTANGVAVCTAVDDQYAPTIVADGAGGAILAWVDERTVATADIYVQRLNASGTPQWSANGVALCTATNAQYAPRIVGDGSGGAIVAWEDLRSGNYDIYARRVNSSGAPQWAANGVVVCSAAEIQFNIAITSDRAGGAFIAWQDLRDATDYEIYAQRVNATGAAIGTANGVVVCNGANSQGNIDAVADGEGGVILAWRDFRSGTTYDIYAQRLNASLAAFWNSGGREVCVAAGDQQEPTVCSDGSGGAIIAWRDGRGADLNVYAQRVNANGNPSWTADGIAVCSAADSQSDPDCESDGVGGAIIAWEDERGGWAADTYAQRVSGSGSMLWASGGAAVLAAGYNQNDPIVVTDGAGGAIVVCADNRTITGADLYCQRIERYGQLGNPEPTITAIKDVKNDQGGLVKVSWSASYLDADPVFGVFDYRLWRSVPTALVQQQALARGFATDPDVAARDGSFLMLPASSQGYAWELAASQTADALDSYSYVAATTADSLPGSFPRTAFMVEARSSSSIAADRWYSAPDSGYSVDNLAPAAPAPLTGQYAAGTARLHWNPNTEPDLAGYRLYRGSSAAFVPAPVNLVADLPDTGYVDPVGAPFVYKLTAVDSHGNESPVAVLIPAGTLAVDGGASPRAFFALAGANPSRGVTALRFGLGAAGRASLALYDAGGRRVRTLVDGAREAGEHFATWDGRDEQGRAVAAGLYFAKLETPAFEKTLRIVRAN